MGAEQSTEPEREGRKKEEERPSLTAGDLVVGAGAALLTGLAGYGLYKVLRGSEKETNDGQAHKFESAGYYDTSSDDDVYPTASSGRDFAGNDYATAAPPLARSRPSLTVDMSHIGANMNEWQKPLTQYGSPSSKELFIQNSDFIGDIDFGKKEWARSRDAVDYVMTRMLEEIRKRAVAKYEGLRIDSYIRQGSSRDGLKVIAPDEFDTVIEFHIEGLKYETVPVNKHGQLVPGYCYFEIIQSKAELMRRFPRLYKDGVFQDSGDTFYLSPKHLHETVFTSLVDTAALAVQHSLAELYINNDFTITRKKNPPAINITINLNDEAYGAIMKQGKLPSSTKIVNEIDLDIVPAIKLRKDAYTTYEGSFMGCPVHAVCKWVEGDTVRMLDFVTVDRISLVWHVNSAGYEKHTLDIARSPSHTQQRYILTALRIMKTVFVREKQSAKAGKTQLSQLVSVLKSYHLKQIALYVIMYTCHLDTRFRLTGAHDALECFIYLLEAALQVRHLPHFFYSNNRIEEMYPGFPTPDALRYDHFRKAASDSLGQALMSLRRSFMVKLQIEPLTNAAVDKQEMVEEFKRDISGGIYF